MSSNSVFFFFLSWPAAPRYSPSQQVGESWTENDSRQRAPLFRCTKHARTFHCWRWRFHGGGLGRSRGGACRRARGHPPRPPPTCCAFPGAAPPPPRRVGAGRRGGSPTRPPARRASPCGRPRAPLRLAPPPPHRSQRRRRRCGRALPLPPRPSSPRGPTRPVAP